MAWRLCGALRATSNVRVLAIAERNRAKMSTGGLDASAGSRRFEYGAESVLALNREKDEGADGEAKITLTIEKNRNGASGRASTCCSTVPSSASPRYDVERVAERPVLSLADLEGFDPSAPARGRERRFCCPLPGCADKRRDGRHRSLAVNVDTRQWHCHRCDASGLLREHWPHREPRFNARRASSRRAFALNEPPVPAVANLARPEPLPDRSVVGERWRLVFQRAPQVNTDPGAVYLGSRGIPLQVAQTCGARYLAAWPHWEVERGGNWVLRATSRRVVFPVLDLAGQLTAIQVASSRPRSTARKCSHVVICLPAFSRLRRTRWRVPSS